MDRSLYRSLAAHEIAHALALESAVQPPLSVRGSEYVAYVAMFATMSPTHRDAILAATPESKFERESQISDSYFYLAPLEFGVSAYRHFLRPEVGAPFLLAILRGKSLPAGED